MSSPSPLAVIDIANNNVHLGLLNVQEAKFKDAVAAYTAAADVYRKVLQNFQGAKEIIGLLEVTLELLKNEISAVHNVCESAWDSISTSSETSEDKSHNVDWTKLPIKSGCLDIFKDQSANFQGSDENIVQCEGTGSVHFQADEEARSTENDSLSGQRKRWEKYFENLAERPRGNGFKDIIGHSKIKTLLVSTLFLHPESQFHYLIKDPTAVKPNILLYGPPGTGKTKLARAYSTESRTSTFIPVTASDLLSKWIGESENRLKALLDVAERLAPTVIFIDEVDGILGGERDNHNSSNFITEFLIRIENVLNVQVLAATNIPWWLQSSVLRRFQYIIEVPLPNLFTRIEILRQFVGSTSLNVSEVELGRHGKLCDRYSLVDLQRAMEFAKILPSLLVQRSLYFKSVEENGQSKYTPCSSQDILAEPAHLEDLLSGSIVPPPVNYTLLKHAIETIKCSADLNDHKNDNVEKYKEFSRRYGNCMDFNPECLLSPYDLGFVNPQEEWCNIL